jgi:uncharacterized protein YbjT (DUF2867 family)
MVARQDEGMARVVLVAGASGFIGSHLVRALDRAGYEVRAMTRRPEAYHGVGRPVGGDVTDPGSLDAALTDVDAAYYLVHSLESADFRERDAAGARAFSGAGARAGLERIIYLGGLGADQDRLSPHLASRREVERILASDGVPVTVLRASVVIGHGGVSWEIIRQLVDHLPALVTPRWVYTRTQPIALPDVIRYLVGVLEPVRAKGRVYEIGGPEVLRYLDLLERAAAVRNKPLPNITLPLLTPRLSSAWLALVTNVNFATARTLVDSMINEVVVQDDAILELVPGRRIGYDEAVRLALAERNADRAVRPGSASRHR